MLHYLKNKKDSTTQAGRLVTNRAFTMVDGVVTKASKDMDGYIAPIRTSVLMRFPILFSLLTTFGVALTFLGFEKIVSNITFLNEHPFLMLILGISILAATGTLYKKLS